MGWLDRLAEIDFILMDKGMNTLKKRLEGKLKENEELNLEIDELNRLKQKSILEIATLMDDIQYKKIELKELDESLKKEHLREVRILNEISSFSTSINKIASKNKNLKPNKKTDLFE